MNRIVEQGPCLRRRHLWRRLIHWRHRQSRIRIPPLVAPERIHHRKCPEWQEDDGVAAGKPYKPRESPGLFEKSLGNEDVNRQSAAHGQQTGGLESDLCTVHVRRGFASGGTVN